MRAAAFEELEQYYADVFTQGRNEYAIPRRRARAIRQKQRQMAHSSGGRRGRRAPTGPVRMSPTRRTGRMRSWSAIAPTAATMVWSVISFVLLLAGSRRHGLVLRVAGHRTVDRSGCPERDPLLGLRPTPSQTSDSQVFLRGRGAVGGAGRAGRDHRALRRGRRRLLRHSAGDNGFRTPSTRTWHLQIGIFWIATSWLATGLYVAPAVSGAEPKGQRLGVNVLFVALVARRRRLARRRMAGHPAEARQPVVLVRTRVTNTWTSAALADPAVRRPGLLAVADVARVEPGAGASATKIVRC